MGDPKVLLFWMLVVVVESYERDALMALRGQPDFTLVAMLSRIGSRYCKGFASVSSGKNNSMFSLVSPSFLFPFFFFFFFFLQWLH